MTVLCRSSYSDADGIHPQAVYSRPLLFYCAPSPSPPIPPPFPPYLLYLSHAARPTDASRVFVSAGSQGQRADGKHQLVGFTYISVFTPAHRLDDGGQGGGRKWRGVEWGRQASSASSAIVAVWILFDSNPMFKQIKKKSRNICRTGFCVQLCYIGKHVTV